jgi:hypothetical protein
LKFLCLCPNSFKLSFLFWIRSMAFKIIREPLSLNPIGYHKDRRILLANSQFGAFFCCSSDIMEGSRVALCAFKMSRKLLNVHSEYGGSCFILSYMRLEQHNRPSWCTVNRAAHAIFWMRTEQIRIRNEQLSAHSKLKW